MTDNVNDPVNHPIHYRTGSVECIDAIESALTFEQFYGYCKAAAIKYIWRADHKDANIQDLDKAIWYLTRARNKLEER
tara:strand:+ start:342 stop:575 length:234 start_codon:yes stop_codon:yes gene_type:complete